MTAPIDCIGPCGVCGRQHHNLGYSPNDRAPALWVCEDCIPYARKVYHMPDTEFSLYEKRALERAGEIAGAYLDDIGKTDLAALTAEEWAEFWRRGVHGFAENIRAQVDVRDGGVPR